MSRVIEMRGVGKQYSLGVNVDTIREAVARLGRRRRDEQSIWALRDFTLDVDRGARIGVIGRNGSGKSTLLKILAGVTTPTEGFARVRGSVGALLEVGTGFHSELTGRENVFLNGALLGMSNREIRSKLDSIVDFAGLSRFMDTPVKRYSSGMQLRLAFAVAAYMEAEILAVDEVLAVGDRAFQEQCIGRLSELGDVGRTMVYVSHDLGTVTRLCSHAVWLDAGLIRQFGPATAVVQAYLASLPRAEEALRAELESGPIRVSDLELSHSSAGHRSRLEPLTLGFTIRLTPEAPRGVQFAVYLSDARGQRLIDEGLRDPQLQPGTHRIEFAVPPVLPVGDYVLGLWVGTEYEDYLDEDVLGFRVDPAPTDSAEHTSQQRIIQPGVQWTVTRETVRGVAGPGAGA